MADPGEEYRAEAQVSAKSNSPKFYAKWWFKLLLAPLLVLLIGSVIVFLILPKEKFFESGNVNVGGNLNVNGDFVQGNQYNIAPQKAEEKRIIVTPRSISMVAGQSRKFVMKVTNNKDIPLYSLHVSFEIEGGDFLTNDIKIESVDKPSITEELGDEKGKVVFSFDGIQFHSKSKRNGELAQIEMDMIIDNISAHATKDYIVNIDGESRRENSLLHIEISQSSEDPNPIFSGKLPPSPEDEFYQQGNSMTDQGNFIGAVDSYKKANAINPKSAKVINNWGIALQYMGKLDEANGKYDEAIRVNPNFSPAYFNKGFLYYNTRRFGEAIDNLELAISLNPNHIDSYFICAKAYEAMGNFDRAASLYNKIIEKAPDLDAGKAAIKALNILKKKVS